MQSAYEHWEEAIARAPIAEAERYRVWQKQTGFKPKRASTSGLSVPASQVGTEKVKLGKLGPLKFKDKKQAGAADEAEKEKLPGIASSEKEQEDAAAGDGKANSPAGAAARRAQTSWSQQKFEA